MVIPTVLDRTSWFYAVGNTPATNLTRTVPNGVDASVLSLGCGDLRNLLFTCYMQEGLPERKVDFTLCDHDESVLARNLMLLTLIIDGGGCCSNEDLWEAYYALRLTDSLSQTVHNHATRLLSLLETPGSWKSSRYGTHIQFCDEDTLKDVAATVALIRDASVADRDEAISSLQANLSNARRYGVLARGGPAADGFSANYTGIRSAGPCSMQALNDVLKTFREYWEDVEPHTSTSKRTTSNMMPNAMLAGLLTDEHPLHYGTDPTHGFHLAAAYAPLVAGSPTSITQKSSKSKLMATAYSQFSAWVSAYRASYKKLYTVKIVVADVFAFAHTLQYVSATGDTCAGWYRRQLDSKPLRLDEKIYGNGPHSAKKFDAVDTSNVADHFGALNVLVATVPLLKEEPWATITTELLIKRSSSQKEAVEKLLCGHWPTMSLLLGVNPIQLWTNARLESPMEDFFLQLMSKPETGDQVSGQMHSRIAWKLNDQVFNQTTKRVRTEFAPKELAKFLCEVYWDMCSNKSSRFEHQKVSPYPYYHNGSFVAFLRAVKRSVSIDWQIFLPHLIDQIFPVEEGQTLLSASRFASDLLSQLQIQDLWTVPVLSIQTMPDVKLFQGWQQPAWTVAVTAEIPKSHISMLFSGHEVRKFSPPVLYGQIKTGLGSHTFPGLHLAWGNIVRSPPSSSGNPNITIEEDDDGFEGNSPLLVSFMVPTCLLVKGPHTVKVKVCVLDVANGALLYAPLIGTSLDLFDAGLLDESRVYISEHLPGQTGFCSLAGRFESETYVPLETENSFLKSTANIENIRKPKISTLSTRLDISSKKGKRLLRDKCTVTLRTADIPYAIDICLGKDELVLRELFPLPVDKASAKVRIARTSGWVEVTASVAEPVGTEGLQPYILPAGLNSSSIPAALNMQYLNLDKLPVIDMNVGKNQLEWLTTLWSIQWSPREKKIRSAGQQSAASPADILRVNFKESLFTIMMVASGLQGEQTGLFTLQNPDRGGAHMLLVVSAFRLDGDTRSVVIDAAIIPMTMALVTSGEIQDFLLFIQTLKSVAIKVDDDELALWKMVIPSMAERCRTWPHLPSCEYKSPGATIPLNTGFGEQLLCSCGNGQLPSAFVSVPEWELAAPHAVRVALSPVFAVQYVEDLFEPEEQNPDTAQETCRRCEVSESSLGKKLLRCSGCKDAKYCSVECQKKAWKVHKMECRRK